MQQFRADLHIHSRFSRATSAKLTPQHLAAWARVKGLDVLGSGDFTHSQWRDELRRHLVFDEASGLHRLRAAPDMRRELPEYASVPGPDAGRDALFMLQGEISSIYKRGGATRRVHNLVYMPSLEAADKFCVRLAQVGNLESDGRPILGLDSRNLLEMVLEADERAFLIPAHIWTPWFSLFGSKSGFDTLEDCFGDLSSEIFALETGLSSDPDMNRLWSALDRYKLVSNSDAHSGENLGREANLFSGRISYDGIYRALKGGSPDTVFQGTLEFFPEEGKYHLDGHRDCKVVLDPHETKELGGLCPVCGKPLTVGVLNRVLELADRDAPAHCPDQSFLSLVPLPELLAEILGSGPRTRKVTAMHARAVARFGSELAILQAVPPDELARFLPPLGEAVSRMRRGEVARQGGYDGEYGVIRVFSEQERREFTRGSLLSGFTPAGAAVGLRLNGAENGKPSGGRGPRKKKDGDAAPAAGSPPGAVAPASATPPAEKNAAQPAGQSGALSGPVCAPAAETPLLANAAQAEAVGAGPGPVLVLAGPGTGKTRTLVQRATRLLRDGASPRQILAVTFTRRAAAEMDERLAGALAGGAGEAAAQLPRTDTLHALAFELWHRTHDEAPVLLGEEAARRVFAEANAELSASRLRDAWDRVTLAREKREAPDGELSGYLARYSRQKGGWNLADYTDLLEFWLEQIQTGLYSAPWSHILVDEIQDLSTLQLTLIKALLPSDGRGFFGIGDPDQSIYGFRGASGRARDFLAEAWPGLKTVSLRENYRSSPAIVRIASSLMRGRSACGELVAASRLADDAARIHLFEAPTAEAEAAWIAAQIRGLVGGSSLTLRDQVRETGLAWPEIGACGLSDIAILVRMRALAPLLQKSLVRVGLAAAVPEEEGFWMDARVGLLIRAAGRMLGIADAGEEDRLPCPDHVLARGPAGIAAYFGDLAPFDALFWQSGPFKALGRAYAEYGGWSGLINWVNLQTELELVRARSERIQIMSLHAAKGLEFKAVFLPALEDGILPFAGPQLLAGQVEREGGIPPDAEEERRLLYVGITRARESLFLSHALRRRLYGRDLRLKSSRFFDDLPLEGLTRSALVEKHKREEKQLKLL